MCLAQKSGEANLYSVHMYTEQYLYTLQFTAVQYTVYMCTIHSVQKSGEANLYSHLVGRAGAGADGPSFVQT